MNFFIRPWPVAVAKPLHNYTIKNHVNFNLVLLPISFKRGKKIVALICSPCGFRGGGVKVLEKHVFCEGGGAFWHKQYKIVLATIVGHQVPVQISRKTCQIGFPRFPI